MSISGGPNTINDGLVFMWDVANIKSWQSGSNVGNDLGPSGSILYGTGSLIYNTNNKGYLEFPGGLYVNSITSSLSYTFSSSISICAWVNIANLASFRNIISSIDDFGINGWEFSYSNDGIPYSDGKLRFLIGYDNAGNYYSNVSSANQIYANTWQYLVVTHVAQPLSVKMYVNGLTMPTTINSSNQSVFQYTPKQIRIGSTVYSTVSHTGSLSFASIYNRVLSANEVLQNYNATKGRYNL